MKIVLHVTTFLIALVCLSCHKSELKTDTQNVQPQQQKRASSDTCTGIVQEVLQGNTYTYLKVKESDTLHWVATSKREMEAGETVTFKKSLAMTNFTSKELGRTFETIYFVGRIDTEASSSVSEQNPMAGHQKPAVEKKGISIEPVEGGISIADLFTNRDAYANKVVRIKGQVTKVNLSIMGRNWVHLQDGTGEAGNNDLLVTTQDAAGVGDIVIFEGTIALNKDFGSGYSYDVLMENAKRAAE